MFSRVISFPALKASCCYGRQRNYRFCLFFFSFFTKEKKNKKKRTALNTVFKNQQEVTSNIYQTTCLAPALLRNRHPISNRTKKNQSSVLPAHVTKEGSKCKYKLLVSHLFFVLFFLLLIQDAAATVTAEETVNH